MDGDLSHTILHESIHSMQQREMLYVFFYVWYLAEWLIRVLFTKHRFSKDAYRNISFEREAYKYDAQSDYISSRKHYHWIHFLF